LKLETRNIKGQQSVDAEHGVIKIAPTRAVLESTILILLAEKKGAHQSRGVSEELRRQPGDLQHFQPHAHRRNSYLSPFRGRQSFDLFNDFERAQVGPNIYPPAAPWQRVKIRRQRRQRRPARRVGRRSFARTPCTSP